MTGVLMMATGAGLGAWGAPYHMLDWGGTLVLSGTTLGSAGAIVVMLAAVLGQLGRMAATAADAKPVVLHADASPAGRADPPLDTATVTAGSEAPPQGAGPVVSPVAATAAVVAGGGLATAAASILSSVSARPDEAGLQAKVALDAPVTESPAYQSPDRDALFSKVEDAVRALKADADAGLPGTTQTGMDADRDAFSDLRADLRAADGETLEASVSDTDDADDSRIDDDRADEPAVDLDEGRPAQGEERHAGREPAASDEGVVAAYTVGDISYTMFADGRIRADSPEGEQVFGSMDELKAHMAKRRTGTA
jgi:hypothetical protein